MNQKKTLSLEGYKPSLKDGYKPTQSDNAGKKVTNGYQPEKSVISTPSPTPPKKG